MFLVLSLHFYFYSPGHYGVNKFCPCTGFTSAGGHNKQHLDRAVSTVLRKILISLE